MNTLKAWSDTTGGRAVISASMAGVFITLLGGLIGGCDQAETDARMKKAAEEEVQKEQAIARAPCKDMVRTAYDGVMCPHPDHEGAVGTGSGTPVLLCKCRHHP